MIDLDSLTLGELAKIEDLSGQPIGDFADDGKPKGKALAAVALIIKRRTGFPQFTWNEAQALTMAETNELLGLDDDEDTPAPKASTSPQPQPEI